MCILYSWVTLAFVEAENSRLQVPIVFEVFENSGKYLDVCWEAAVPKYFM